KDTMADIEINLPPLFEQKLVVKRIETISSEIYINNQINDNLVFQKYFYKIIIFELLILMFLFYKIENWKCNIDIFVVSKVFIQ
ncbi:restriction endonuclease subunit S, partial [Bombilactobacillus mellis]|uniref:restriction endonuclease subunit S n=1 Tax=Bombilactobacillus mellis TaxID=1218508 RepID=UPI00157FE5A6